MDLTHQRVTDDSCISSLSSCFLGQNNCLDTILSWIVKICISGWIPPVKEQPQDNGLAQNMMWDIYCVVEDWFWFCPHLEWCWLSRKVRALSLWMAACSSGETTEVVITSVSIIRWTFVCLHACTLRKSGATKRTSSSMRLGLPLKDLWLGKCHFC